MVQPLKSRYSQSLSQVVHIFFSIYEKKFFNLETHFFFIPKAKVSCLSPPKTLFREHVKNTCIQ